jgi:hypothetical protein
MKRNEQDPALPSWFRVCLTGGATLSGAIMLLGLSGQGCDEGAGAVRRPSEDAGSTADGASPFTGGREVRVQVAETARTFLDLATGESTSTAPSSWDLAFEGYDIFTSSGPSATGASREGAAFGPLDSVLFAFDEAPFVPFMTPDRTGGAFLDWYKYEGSPNHVLWSRFHVIGVKDGERLFKVQVLTYYGERDGAAIPALYKIRYAAVAPPGPLQEVSLLDGSAGGASAPPTAKQECLDLGTGARIMLSTDEARTSSAWHLCFRRQSIFVNGESGGPRGVGAVNLQASAIATEDLAAVKQRTEVTERARFDAVTAADFEGRVFRGDRVVSAFNQAWFDPATRSPLRDTWLVASANGKQKYLVGFDRFEGATSKTPNVIVLRVKAVKG